MAPPDISYEEELAIVRKFLRKNNIDKLMAALSTWCCQAPGARINSGASPVPMGTGTTLDLSQNVEWDTDGFFNAGQPSRLTIPPAFEGRYFIHATLWWYRIMPGIDFTIPERDGGHFSAEISKNDLGPLEGARSTAAPVVTGHATSQNILWEGFLAVNDFVEVNVWQNVDDNAVVDAWLTLRRA